MNLNLTEQQFEDFVFQVVIMASHSGGEEMRSANSKYFKINFEICVEDDKKMEQGLKKHLDSYMEAFIERVGIIRDSWDPSFVVLTAEQCMLGAYILTKLGNEDRISKLGNRIVENVTAQLFDDQDLDIMVAGRETDIIKEARDLYDYCGEFGEKVARESNC